MIRINLAGSGNANFTAGNSMGLSAGELSLSDDDSRKEGLKRILIMSLFPLALFVYEQQNLPAKQAELANKTRLLSELQAFNSKMVTSVTEIKKFKEDEAKIQARIGILEKLSRDRLKEIRIMDLFQQVIPDKVWFTRLEMTGTKISVTGYAMSDFDISSFMEALSKSAFLLDVNLVNSSEQTMEGQSVKKFEISCLTEKMRE